MMLPIALLIAVVTGPTVMAANVIISGIIRVQPRETAADDTDSGLALAA